MIPLSEYPRPQFKRDSYISLNGRWEYKISKDEALPEEFDGTILVPFSPETTAADLRDKNDNKVDPIIVQPDDYLFYHLSLDIPSEFEIKDKVILHFTAVDQIASIYLNKELGKTHVGGFLPFEVDIAPYIKNRHIDIIVKVIDKTDTSYHSRGKQKLKHGGIWYTPQSGIYLPVWLESVSNGYFEDIKLTPDIDNSILKIHIRSALNETKILFEGKEYSFKGNDYNLEISNPRLWSPEDPYLYNITFINEVDKVDSYFGMRKFSIIKDENNILRFALNNKPYFMKGVLDQGYYQNSLLTPPNDEAYIKDISLMKSLGFNTLRKHIKIESLRYYYHCDRLGMIVFQDFVNGGSTYKTLHILLPVIFNIKKKDNRYKAFSRNNKEGREEAINEFKETINYLYNVPSLGLWTIFNEGWGQFDSASIYNELIKYDYSRIYDHASGFYDQGVSDTKSIHVYFRPVKLTKRNTDKNRALFLSECGGYKLEIEGHSNVKKTFGYKTISSKEELENEYIKFINRDIINNIPKGLSSFIYTELSDVEEELNGFITYDREVVKVDINKIKAINDKVKL